MSEPIPINATVSSIAPDNDKVREVIQAANDLLTDEQIRIKCDLDKDQFALVYPHIVKTRIEYQRQLNRLKKNSLPTDLFEIDALTKSVPRSMAPKIKAIEDQIAEEQKLKQRNNVTVKDILNHIELKFGDSFSSLVAQGYYEAVESGNLPLRFQYEKALLGKILADKIESVPTKMNRDEMKTRIKELTAKIKHSEDKSE